MATLLYKDFLIIGTSQFDKDTQLWMPMADISRDSTTGYESHNIKDSVNCFGIESEAETFALEIAKAWVDERTTLTDYRLPSGVAMELRNHPLMSYRNVPSWPPAWEWISGPEDKRPRGEVGILKRTGVNRSSLTYHCFLWMEYEGSVYLGCLLLSDGTFCEQLCKLLQENIGRSIEDIGSLDLSYLG